MKKLLLTIIILGACLVGSSQNWDSVRVGNLDVDSIMLGGVKIWEKKSTTPVFDEVIIGTQTWMAKNLDIDDGLGGIYAYNNDEGNVATYGRLYTWDAAVRVAASIDGWHLPSRAEFEILMLFYGDTLSSDEDGVLYTNPPVGLNRVGGGRADIASTPPFGYLNEIWEMWATDTSIAGWDIFSETEKYYYIQYNVPTELGFSVRLIKD